MVKIICWSSNCASESWFKWPWMWRAGMNEYFRNCRSTRIFTHNHLEGLQRMGRKRENIQWSVVLWAKIPSWCQRSEENDWFELKERQKTTEVCRRASLNSTTYRTLKQMGYSSRRTHRVPNLSDEQETEATIYTRSPKLDRRRLEIQMVESEFGVNNMKA